MCVGVGVCVCQVIESPHVDDLGNMPDDVIAELKHVLKKESSAYGDNTSKAFMLAMVSMIGGYRKALKFREVSTIHTLTVAHLPWSITCTVPKEECRTNLYMYIVCVKCVHVYIVQ